MRTWIAALLVLLALPAGAEKVYKWVDEDGVVHFGAEPPRGQAADTVDVRPTPGNSAVEPSLTLPDEKEEEQNSEAEKGASEELTAEQREYRRKRCESARTTYDKIKDRPRIRRKNPETGEYRMLPYEELVAWREELQEDIDTYCGEPER